MESIVLGLVVAAACLAIPWMLYLAMKMGERSGWVRGYAEACYDARRLEKGSGQ